MRIKRICNRNVGPTENIDISFENNDENKPKPVILVGENGTGKSTVLSNVVDAFYEMASPIYNDVKEHDSGNLSYFYKTIMPTEINLGHNYMLSYIEFEGSGNEQPCQYVFKCGQLTYDEFKKETNSELPNNKWNDKENSKSIIGDSKDIKDEFEKSICCYFASDRYEKPIWQGDKYYKTEENEHLIIKQRFDGKLNLPISVKNVTNSTLSWLLDVIVDSRTDIEVQDGQLSSVHANIDDILKLGVARKNIEKIMSEILGKKVYFGLNFRSAHGSRFNIFDEKESKTIVPTLDSLSTGQSALFNIFATIVRYADYKNINQSITLEDIEGIVVIDEIELHLHSKLQREVLPKLLKLFPNIQFVISTHSPLFLLGMDETFGADGYCIYQMPKGNRIYSESFSEFRNAYKYMIQTEKYTSEIKNAIKAKKQKTLIVTEGATDWRHLKASLAAIKNNDPAKYTDLDIEFLEYDPKKF